jgi:hypothetical protein
VSHQKLMVEMTVMVESRWMIRSKEVDVVGLTKSGVRGLGW